MSSTTTTVDISAILEVYCGPSAVITGPVNGLYTVTADDAMVDQPSLEAAVAMAATDAGADANLAALVAKAKAALTSNNNFLLITSPTNAQTITQVKALTRQMNALIKIVVRDLADTSGT